MCPAGKQQLLHDTLSFLHINWEKLNSTLQDQGFFQISSLSRASQVVLFIAAASTCDMSPNKAHALLSISGIHSLAGLPRLRMYLLVNAQFVPGMKEIVLKGALLCFGEFCRIAAIAV